jgi:hypothetical protein
MIVAIDRASIRRRQASGRRLCVTLFALLAGLLAIIPADARAAEPVVSVWYRGSPAGTPRQSDLGAIRALGFNGIVWPKAHASAESEVTRLAGLVGLKVIVADRPVPITGQMALQPPDRIDIVITPETSSMIAALTWRAVAHGARTIAFDSRSLAGAGLEEADGSLKPWVRSAINIARQLTANANLVNLMRPGPGIIVTPDSAPALDVVFLDGDRSWVIVATNTSAAKVAATVRLPTGTPYALWVSWLEGPPLAMISEPAGPRWMLSMEPASARVYIIDKIMK